MVSIVLTRQESPLVKRLAAMALAPCYINCAMSLK